MKTRIISLVNQKGGVGKTTSVKNIGAGLAALNKKVLVIDMDSQASLTNSLGIKFKGLPNTIYEILKKSIHVKDAVIKKSNCLSLIPSNIKLAGFEIELSAIVGREFLLKEAISSIVSDYHYILLDCPPSLGLLTLNALTVSKEIFIPAQTEYLALEGIVKILETADLVKTRLNPDLQVTGVIGTLFDSRKKLAREVVEKLQIHFKDKLFKTLIKDNIALAEAPSFGKDIFSYKPSSSGAECYMNLCKEILNMRV
jgi:chromosome partitioning protein